MYKIIKVIILPLLFTTSLSARTYYVSPMGNNNNEGISESMSFQEVQFAIDKMKSGDTLIILDGYYTGSLRLKSGITIKAKNPRKVVFGGAEALKGAHFTKYKDNIYQAEVSTVPKQLFYQDKPMPWASWPKVTSANNWVKSKKWIEGDQVNDDRVIKADFSTIKDLDLSGGVCYLRDLTSVRRHNIESFDGENLKLETIGNRRKTTSSIFLLAGAVDLVSAPGEWAYKDGTLYFYPPDGKAPNAADFLVQTADYTINEEQAISEISIEGVDFFATSVKLGASDNKNIKFLNVYFTYTGGEIDYDGNKLNPEENKPVQMSGTEILFDKCLFAGARLTALAFTNAPDFIVQNCVFMENNPYGSFGARALTVRANGPFTITRNTFFNVNSDAVSVSFNGFQGDGNPDISYNNIFNAGVFNPDVSGVYLPNKNMYWTEFHHNWAHNCNGNAVRLDQAGQHFSVHHNVCWASRRGLNIEGFDHFNIYNNTSVLNTNACFITRNVDDKRKGNGDATPSHDFSFPPIDDWNVLNNLITRFVDRVGPSEKSQYARASSQGILNLDRPAKWDGTIPVIDRGKVQGNLTGFGQDIFVNGSLDGLNLIPIKKVIKNGVVQTDELATEGIDDLDSFRGAYDVNEKNPWIPGSDWMPYGLPVLKTMAESEDFAKKVRPGSILPEIDIADLPKGSLSLSTASSPDAQQPEVFFLRENDITTMIAKRGILNGTEKEDQAVWGFDTPEDKVTWIVNAPKEDDYTVSVIFSMAEQVNIEVSSGESVLVTPSMVRTWENRPYLWRQEFPGTLHLKAGENRISFRLPDAQPAKAQGDSENRKPVIKFAIGVTEEFHLFSIELGTPAARKAQQERAREIKGDASWMKDGKYGLFVHWSALSYPFHGDQPRAQWFQKSVEMFDVKVFADAVERTGAAWVNFTATHKGFYWPGPNAALDKILPGRTTKRDLLGEIIDELGRRGIRTLLYLHTGYNGYESEFWKAAGAEDADSKRFSDNIEAILRDCSLRYGKRLSGFGYIDGALQFNYPLDPYWEGWARAIKAGNPKALVGFSSNRGPVVGPFSDLSVTDGMDRFEYPDPQLIGPGRQLGDVTTACWLYMDGWFTSRPMNGKFRRGPSHTTEEYVNFFRDLDEKNIPVSINMIMTADVTAEHPIFDPKCMAVMEEVRKAIRGK
jgi:hypothetical protein